MVGKVKHVRRKLHQEAVKLHGEPGGAERSCCPLQLHNTAAATSDKGPGCSKEIVSQSSFPSGIFAATKISTESLIQTLSHEELPQAPPTNTGPAEKKLKSKKEKMKERRERWLSKISSIRQAKELQAAEAQRQATPVVGDLRPLVDALPELCQLINPPATVGCRRKTRKNKTPMKRPEPTDFSQMKQSQKRKLLEMETSRFSAAVKTLSSKQNPLADIGEQLKKRMKREEEQGPS